jgi:predicted metal-dependent peptidase
MFGEGDAPNGAIVGQDGNWMLITDGEGNPIQPDPNDPNAPTPKDLQDLKDEVQSMLEASREESEFGGQGRGSTGGESLRTIAEIDPTQDPKDWKNIVQRFMIKTARFDYSYARPNRGYLIRNGIIVPGLKSDKGCFVIMVDTSGSISRELLTKFYGRVEQIRSQLPDHDIWIVCCDAKVQSFQHILSGTPLKKETRGGGGTDFRPAFEWVRKRGIRPLGALYFTDGDGTCPSRPVEYPVLWVLYGPCTRQPWGEHIIIK